RDTTMNRTTAPRPLDLARGRAASAGPRRLTLLVAACARRFLPWTASEWPRQVVDQLEALADGRPRKGLNRVLSRLGRVVESLRQADETDPRAAQHFRVLRLFQAFGTRALTANAVCALLAEAVGLSDRLDPDLLVRPRREAPRPPGAD